MKKLLLLIVFFCLSFFAKAQTYQRYDAGIGLRIGDPFGLTYKYYMPRATAFEINFGSTSSGFYSDYYQAIFDDISQFEEFQYAGHQVNYALDLQGRLLFHNDFPEDIDGLEWYYGFGAQMRLSGIKYRYITSEGTTSENYTDIGLGPDGIIGAEYIIPDVPLTAFIDVNLFVELINNPFRFQFQGGIGIRYDFNFN